MSGRTPVALFLALVYSLGIGVSLVVWSTGGGPFPGFVFVVMFLPAIAAWIVQAATTAAARIDWQRFPAGYLPIALLLMPLTLHAILLAQIAQAGPLPWQDWLTPGADGLYHAPASRGWGALTLPGLVAHIVLNAAIGLVVVSALALFEEIGWRGWLLPRLIDRLGVRPAIVTTSVLWALWHVPFSVAGVQHIAGLSAGRAALVIPFGVLATGLIIGWLWVRTGSIWIVALAHGALNNWGQFALKYMRDFTVPDPVRSLVVATAGLYVAAALLLTFAMPLAGGTNVYPTEETS